MPFEDEVPILTTSGNTVSSSPFLSSLLSVAVKGGTVISGLVSIALGLLYMKQDNLLYFPEISGVPRRPRSNPRKYRSPDEYNLPFESHMIQTADGVSIHSWLLLQQPNNSSKNSDLNKIPTIIFFHGNAGNIGLRLPNAAQMYRYLKANILLVEYRGYGDSDDTKPPNERGLKLDSEAALRFIRTHPKIDENNLYIFGRSLGGAVGFHLAHYAEQNNIHVNGLIVENTFLSIGKMVDTLMPLVAPFKALILRINWDSGKVAKKLNNTPVLYLAGSADQLVPFSHMKELYKTSQGLASTNVIKLGSTRMHVIKGGTHNESWYQGGTAYWESMKIFISDTASSSVSGQGYGITSPHSSMSSVIGHSDSDLSTTAYERPSKKGNSESNLAVHMGGVEVEVSADGDVGSGSIPIMPSNLMGMAREAAASASSTSKDSGKKKSH